MEIISPIVEIIGEYSVRPIGKQFGYIVSYKSSIAILEEKFQKLHEKNDAVKQSVDGAEWNQEVASIVIKKWQTKVEKKIEEVGKFLGEDVKANRMCLNGWCPNLKLCYSLGKKAQKNTHAIDELLKECENEKYVRPYNKLTVPPSEVIRSLSTGPYEDFESRNSTTRNILEALRNDEMNIIALCGMGGIGKTEMAIEIARRVEGTDNLFKKVAIAVVTKNPNPKEIQDKLAKQLGELDEDKAKKVLVILDDVWENFDLKQLVGIAVYDAVTKKKCKILLTSRSEEICNTFITLNNQIFSIGFLFEKEAWNLFKDMVGDCINNDTPNDLIQIAQLVAKECAGLPLAIRVVGSALRNKREKIEWAAVLRQLQMSIPQNIPGMDREVYSSIEFSYNYLESKDAKSCFLLCCLYPEDYDIPVEHLVRYGVGKRFFENRFSIVDEIREGINKMVRDLRRSNLLLDSQKDECVKMHDVVRDVAISIASREEHGFMVELDRRIEEWPQKDTYDSYTTISLLLGEMKGHLDGLKCPKLQLLRLSCLKNSNKFPSNLFNGMNELKMLSLQEGCFSLTSLPLSIQILENLRMLNLESCRLRDVSAIGSLGKLEILGFRDSKIEELPHEIGNLSQLKLLDMKGCRSLNRIAAGVLSSLSRLQELYMGEFKNWECTTTVEGNGEGTSNNASLVELIPHFGQKKVLEISIPSIGCLPKKLHFDKSNLRFRINIEDDGRYLFENAIRFDEWEDANDIGKVLLENRSIFGNLEYCGIYNCQRSENIFWLAMVRDLDKLKSLDISECENIQEIFSKEGDQDKENVVGGNIRLPNLKKIRLQKLPRFIGINKSMDSVEVEGGEGGNTSSTTVSHKLFSSNTIFWFPNLVEVFVQECELLEVVFDLEGLKVIESHQLKSLKLKNLSRMAYVWKNIPRGFTGFQNLTSINISQCQNLRSLLPASVAKLLVQLQTVDINQCKLMENILQREDEVGEERSADIIVFPRIHTFKLYGLGNLVSFSSKAHSFEWPSIKKIYLVECPKLKTFGSEIQSGRKLRKKDAELDTRAPQEPSASSSLASARESSRLFNRCLELSCIPRPRNYNPDEANCSSSSKENKHSFNKDQVTLTNQDEPNVSTETENQTKMSSLFPYYLIPSLENLEQLKATYCGSLEVIFELEGLNVEESNILNNLTELRLLTLPKLLHIWKKGPRDIKGFNNLRCLSIRKCHSLKCLFTPSISKLLVKLEEINVDDCYEMEEIIAKESGDEEKIDHLIAFPQLKTLKLWNLPKLECFCNQAIALEWPSIKTFGSKVQSRRKLTKKDAELDARAPQEPSASSSSASTRESSRLFNRCLELSCIPRPRTYNPDQENCISSSEENKHNFNKDQVTLMTKQDEPNVSTETENQTKMSSLFPYYLIPSLENLEELSASLCGSLEVIFELEGLNVEESNIFNNLTKLSLSYLWKLLHIWKKGPRDIKGFNNLRLLQVAGCDSLKCLFTPSIAKLLVKLEEIYVSDCNEMEEIIAKESGDEEKRDHVIAFPQVKTLLLKYLPKLECFCNEAISFEWPSLENITMYGCRKLKMFVSTSMKTPKLKGVHTGYKAFQTMIEGDLNTTIQHIIKGKTDREESKEESEEESKEESEEEFEEESKEDQ